MCIPLPLALTPKRVKPQQIAPGLLLFASMRNARCTSPARRAILSFSTTTARWSTSKRAGGSRLLASISPLPMAVGLDDSKQKIAAFPTKQIKRVRIVHRADGYYVQFVVKADRIVKHIPTGKAVGIDVGLASYYTDSEGNTVENPRHYRKAEKPPQAVARPPLPQTEEE
jgi:transposase